MPVITPKSPASTYSIAATIHPKNPHAQISKQLTKYVHQYSERDEVPAHSENPRRQNAPYARNIFVYVLLV